MADEEKDKQAPQDDKDAASNPPAADSGDSDKSKQDSPADALTRTNDDLAAETPDTTLQTDAKTAKKPGGFKTLIRHFNIYFLTFLLIVVIAVVVTVVYYLNSKKAPKAPEVATQTLTADALKQLANSDATVGDSGQTLTVQGNAIFDGQVLVRSNLNVAGTIQLGGTFSVPDLTVGGTANLSDTQINRLQVATGSTFQGTVTLQHDLNVAGTASFSGPTTIGNLTVNKLTMAGNAELDIPNHISFTGYTPNRTIDTGALGGGGSASVQGSDTAGTVNINTGNNPAPGCFVTMTFNTPFTNIPHVVVTPVNRAAGQTQFYVERTKTTLRICSANAAPANQVFAYDYFITN